LKPHILLVDDEPAIQFGFSRFLGNVGFSLESVSTLSAAKDKIHAERFDAILLDMKLPDGNGLEWIREIRPTNPDVAIVLITGHGDIPLAVEAMRSGADHFLTKPVNMTELEVFLRKSLELGALRRETRGSRRLKKTDEPFFGESQVMRKILDMASLGAESDSPILLLGETGTGKGVLARWIHDRSPRTASLFVEINCTSLKGDLLISELFGHAKGAFTSSVSDKQGLIEVADQGTLFLDEIGDMEPGIQSQFLKVIEEKQFRRLGEVKQRSSDFRLICATNLNLIDETEKGRFRKDLYFRIAVFPISLPPLRERIQDLPGWIHYFLNLLGRKQPDPPKEVLDLLERYAWPGNIRELRNVLERAVLISRGKSLGMEHFPGLVPQFHEAASDGSGAVDLESMEEAHIRAVMDRCSGDTKKAAEALGISRASLYRKLEKYKKHFGF
jgi:DNA-binding NtrC family response regulator